MALNPAIGTGGHPYPAGVIGETQSAAYTGTASTAILVPVGVSLVAVQCSTAAYVTQGTPADAPTSANGMPLGAGQIIYLTVQGGLTTFRAVQSAAGGNIYVTAMG